jgi:hypothetical protein
MLKAYSEQRNRCYLHPHRPAEAKCERCKTGLCAECERTFKGQLLCEHCYDEQVYLEESKPTFGQRVREWLTSLRNSAIVVAVLALIGVGLFFVFRDTLNRPITPEEMARFRYAASGSFQTPEGINVNSTVLGAKLVAFASQRPGFEATHLINEYVGDGYPGWRSATASYPQDVVVEHDSVSNVSKVILTQQPNEPKDTWARTIEVDVSTDGPDRGFVKVGQWQLAQTTDPQKFTFPAAPSKWIRLRILSNYGSAEYTSLGEFDAYVVPQGPGAAPTSNP